MNDACTHLDGIRGVTPSALGCEECLKIGSPWVHLRLCRTCGHVGCCDSSPNRHATKHFHATHHPIIEGYDPPEGWGWCYIDELMFDLSGRMTPHNGPIPRYVWGGRNIFEERAREGFDVFVHDGNKAFGSVREVGRNDLVIYVENAGDFRVPFSAITDVHSEKVILNCAKLDMNLRRAIGHAHEGEDPRI